MKIHVYIYSANDEKFSDSNRVYIGTLVAEESIRVIDAIGGPEKLKCKVDEDGELVAEHKVLLPCDIEMQLS
tara:strand:- start:178 stop:393 length:216 start_codon:yes stop_codon:yes gene_type:complete